MAQVAGLLLLLFYSALAVIDANADELLRNLATVQVEINGTDEAPINRHLLQTDIELELRRAGLRVAPSATARIELLVLTYQPPGLPGNYFYTAQVRLREAAATIRGVAPHAVTWQSTIPFGVGVMETSNIRQVAKDLVGEFLNSWFSANPRR